MIYFKCTVLKTRKNLLFCIGWGGAKGQKVLNHTYMDHQPDDACQYMNMIASSTHKF